MKHSVTTATRGLLAALAIAAMVASAGCMNCGDNSEPSPNAGAGIRTTVGESVTLDGTGSSDADGDSLRFFWTQDGGPVDVELSEAESDTPTFIASASGLYYFTLEVRDACSGLLTTATSSVLVDVRESLESCSENDPEEPCPDPFEPVCGGDGRTYRNACEACRVVTVYSSEMCENETGFNLTTQADCEEAGGVWGRQGLFPDPTCNLRTTDGGTACTTAADCSGECIDVEGECDGEAGVCADFRITFGCFCPIYDGVPPNVLCVD